MKNYRVDEEQFVLKKITKVLDKTVSSASLSSLTHHTINLGLGYCFHSG